MGAGSARKRLSCLQLLIEFACNAKSLAIVICLLFLFLLPSAIFGRTDKSFLSVFDSSVDTFTNILLVICLLLFEVCVTHGVQLTLEENY